MLYLYPIPTGRLQWCQFPLSCTVKPTYTQCLSNSAKAVNQLTICIVCVCVCVWMWFPIVGWLCRSEVSIKQRWINSSSLFGPLRWQHTIHRAKAHTLSVQHTHTPTHSRTQITCLLSAFSYRLCNDGLFSPQLNTTLGFKDIPLTVCQLWFSLPQTCVHARTQTHRAGGLLALQRGKILAKKKVVASTLWCLRIKVLV